MKFFFAIGPSGVLLVLAPAKAQAKAVTLPDPITPTEMLIDVKSGPGGQDAPSVSRDWSSYNDQTTYDIRSGYPTKLGPPRQVVETIARSGRR